MKPPRVSIAGLMLLVIAVAVNFATARAIGLDPRDYWTEFAPFGSTLLFALHRLTISRGPARMFWGGFLIPGSMSLALLVCFVIDPLKGSMAARLWDGYGTLIYECYAWAAPLVRRLPHGADPIVESVLIGVAFYLPQLLVALAGGLIARFIAKVAARWRGSVAAEDDGRPGAVR